MNFILTSNSYQVTSQWSKEFDLQPKKMKVAFIDTAAEVYNKAEADWLKADRQALIDAGFVVEDYSLIGKTKSQLKTDLAKFDVFFVSGGNTFFLLEHANKSGFTELISEDFFESKTYVGSSAGSVLLSNDIEIIKYLDNPDRAKLESTRAIGIFNFVIFPHWGSPKFAAKYDLLLKSAYSQKIGGLTLADDEYLIFSKNKLRLIK